MRYRMGLEGVWVRAFVPGKKGIIIQKKIDAARQRSRFRFMGWNFPVRDFVKVLLMAQQKAHPSAQISPLKNLSFLRGFH
jgi:hypothetical protein